MDKNKLVNLMCKLHPENYLEYTESLDEFFESQFTKATAELSCTFEDITKKIPHITDSFTSETVSPEWKFICLNFYILNLIGEDLSKSSDSLLSVDQIKTMKVSIEKLMIIGILKNLQPNLPHFVKIPKSDNLLLNYNILKCSVIGFIYYIKQPDTRLLILPNCLQGILVALHQIAFCQLKKSAFTEEIYNNLIKDQELFKNNLNDLRKNIHIAIFVKETMLLFQTNSPIWFKKSISFTLTKIIKSKNGIESIASAMLNEFDDDKSKSWKILDVLTKLILTCKKFDDFQDICSQLITLLDLVKLNSDLIIYERLFISCMKGLFGENPKLCEEIFFKRVTKFLHLFTTKNNNFQNCVDITDDLKQTIRLIYASFIDDNKLLSTTNLKFYINIIFNFYSITNIPNFLEINKELGEILSKYLKLSHQEEMHNLFDSFLFAFPIENIPQMRDDIIIEVNNSRIIVQKSDHRIIYALLEASNNILKLLETDKKIVLFGYMLNCLIDKEKYFKIKSKDDLIGLEDDSKNPALERLLIIHKLLSELSENKNVQISIKNQPNDIIKYFANIFEAIIEKNQLKMRSDDEENSDFQTLFIIVMVLENLILNSNEKYLEKYKILLEYLSKVSRETSNIELKKSCERISVILLNGRNTALRENEQEINELDKAIEDICDPLLPVRGHGLMTLGKLVRKKDKNAMERKQYILNIFQLSLKNEDSFIYLNAIEGLVAMANVFPLQVLNILCEEYSVFFEKNNQEEGHEIRMKLGEVLVRVTKSLGEMAPKYKSLLLNTFLTVSKDDDHLMRASSLSNLGEICKVLGYKLGTIYTEILVCVHAVITTDKAVEARRAAVTVIRQLLAGLDNEMIFFLKEDILPIYRTLKQIYNNDKDDVMKLQAQLALEELNENMKNFVFPKPQLNLEKKIIMLN